MSASYIYALAALDDARVLVLRASPGGTKNRLELWDAPGIAWKLRFRVACSRLR